MFALLEFGCLKKMNCVKAKLPIYMVLVCECVCARVHACACACACPQVQHQDVALGVSSHGILSSLVVFSAFPVFLSRHSAAVLFSIISLSV